MIRYIDVTSLFLHSGSPVGISRVIFELSKRLSGKPIFFFKQTGQFLSTQGEKSPVSFKDGDQIFLTGCVWDYQEGLDVFEVLSASHVRVGITTLIYDIIPAKHSYFVNEETAASFTNWLNKTLAMSSKIITISENSKRDILTWLEKNKIANSPPVHVFRLGDSDLVAASDAPPDKNFVIHVSTIEPRKNQEFLLDVWSYLVEQGITPPKLYFIGKMGWMADRIKRRIDEDPKLQSLVEIKANLTDSELASYYKHCLFSLYPSLYEGWGLPVAESLKFGKLCLSSNTSSMPEIAQSGVIFLDPRDVPLWARMITEKMAAKNHLQITPVEYVFTSWDDSANVVEKILLSL